MINLIAQTIYDKKGNNIVAIDIREISDVNDFVIIAEGNINRHVTAIAREIEMVMKEAGSKPILVEGRSNGDWVVIDFGEIVVHLFMPEMREKYKLEQLYKDGKLIELSINTSV